MTNKPLKIFVGYDTRERDAFEVCKKSLIKHSSIPLVIMPLEERKLRHGGLYNRRWTVEDGQFLDHKDGKPFSTEFSFTRFLVPALCQWNGLGLYCDCDFLWRDDVGQLVNRAILAKYKSDFAVLVVKHKHDPNEIHKMTGQVQTKYYRKNWSSLILWNTEHPSNILLTPEKVNNESGQWLHSFGWLEDHEIGELSEEWNWLSGVSNSDVKPSAVHFTKGTPAMPGCKNFPYAQEWFEVLNDNG